MKEVKSDKKKNNAWIWLAVAVIAVVLILAFYATQKAGDKIDKQLGEDIDSLDVGDNPDIVVDDFDSLEVSEEDITS